MITSQDQFKKKDIPSIISPTEATIVNAPKEMAVVTNDKDRQHASFARKIWRTRSGVSNSVSMVLRSFSPAKMQDAETADAINGTIRKNKGNSVLVRR